MGKYRMFKDLIPYTDIHEMNLDWIIDVVKNLGIEVDELNDIVNNKIDYYVKEYIEENLSNFLLGAMYIEERTCIKLQPVIISGDSDHVYQSNNESIVVLEGR